ncbi:ubiquitin-like modifier-activating enzyme ATG7 isoform X2 [Portunus trituberculatus]|uniref:ubiquitin-like modifier-activating enzyme ATG7 isoform X2 n=1 Tax=Portunus trituberculatus TaxID=210409 RepID=UPI001E1CBD5A|nr:ubiquitin-like modifier-activating enzyme ATG7 isoform X2 [Portunus trituberculatus]
MSAREGVAAGMDHSGREPTILQSVPFSSAVDAGFWHHFTQLKLDVLQLSEQAVPVMGSYTNTDTPGLPPRLYVEYDALERRKTASRWSCHATGTLINTNTIEEFRNRSKQDLLKGSATTLWEAITSGQALQDPSVLASFLMFTFADLKKYHFYYWFAFPAFTYPKAMHKKPPQSFTDALTQKEIESLLASYTSQEVDFNQGFFSITKSDEEFTVHPLRDYPKLRTAADSSNQEVYLGISDPSTLPSNPGWTLRNLLTLVAIRWSKQWQSYKVVCLRVRTRNGVQDASHSLVVEVDLSEEPESLIPSEMPPCLGWEKNERGKMGPRMVNLSANMDPTRLAESAVDLNLKLMRWRVAPQLNLGVVQQTHCLLLGAGTLGCAVARCLMGWGVRHITLVDSAKVSYSNPVRQNLFTFSDCQSGGRHKAVAAAEALLQIFPKMNSKGVVLSIPMPGHTVGESLLNQVKEDVSTLEQLIDEHDAIFLLMDSRESRWLPTVIGAAKQKLVLTAALGFDSFLVMRHGIREVGTEVSLPSTTAIPRNSIPGKMLGCYFCNDVVAPGNVSSTHDRTLDQQCTVTRPGVSYLAAGHVTELLAAILQHPDKGLAEASVKEQGNVKEGVLGPVPHSLRGFLGRHQLLTPASTSFDQCSGCCREVLKAYMEEGFEFLLKVFNSTAYLEEVSGLSRLHHCVDDSQVWELSDEEDME